MVAVAPNAMNTVENPITNAKVKLWQDGELLETKEVNADGFALFENLCEGKYAFDLIAEGYKTIEFFTELGCNEDKSITKYASALQVLHALSNPESSFTFTLQ